MISVEDAALFTKQEVEVNSSGRVASSEQQEVDRTKLRVLFNYTITNTNAATPNN